MTYVGLDPSFTGTGLAIWNGSKAIRTFHISADCGKKRFVDIARAAEDIQQQIRMVLPQDLDGVVLISENPPPQGMFSPGLYGLDVYILNTLWYYNKVKVVSIDVVNPNYLQHLHQKRKYSKSESVKLATTISKALGFNIVPQKRFSADEAEATLFLLRLLVRDKKVVVDSVPELKPFLDQKEVNLYKEQNG